MSSRQAPANTVEKTNADLFKALSVPVRERILIELTERPAGAKELSDLLGLSEEVVAYHLRELKTVGLIEQVGESSTRRRFYKACARPILVVDEWEKLPRLVREVNSNWVGQLLIGDAIASINDMIASQKAGTFDTKPGRAMIRLPLLVDEQGWGELEPAALAYLDALYEIEKKSTVRRLDSGEEGINVIGAVLAFEMPKRA